MGKDGRKPGGGKVVTDSRFAAVHYDPRFQRFPRAKRKVEIDERFAGERRLASLPAACRGACRICVPATHTRPTASDHDTFTHALLPGMFTDEAFGGAARVDKRGRRLPGKTGAPG